MKVTMDALFWVIIINCLAWVAFIWADEVKKRKRLSEVSEQPKPTKIEKVEPIVSCSNYEVDEAYDKLINEILDKGVISGIEEYKLKIRYEGKEYGIWIANKTGAYGNSLESIKDRRELVRGRALKQETLNKLYEKEMAYVTVVGKPITRKEKEDEFIKSMLEQD